MKNFSYWIGVFVISIFTYHLLSCHVQNAKPVTRAGAFPRILERANKEKRFFIMHSAKDTFMITSVIVERSKNQFTVHLNRLDSVHRVHINNPKALGEKRIHVYVQDSASYTLDEPHTIPLNKITKIEMID